ncbi:MAG: preprotein translocase subunit SecG [bacterium]|nr:preprotein translocase subunit SecG [Bacillota bacterium]HHW55040.1 preprotein translocase subunit SecG [Bacillota bacterium]
MSLALTIVHLLVAIALIISVVLQSGKSAGLSGTIAGGAESFFGRKMGLEEKLERITAILAAAFMVTALLSVIF